MALAGFIALGVWQLHRMEWKRDLIARVTARTRAAPVRIPPGAAIASADPHAINYLRVRLSGTYAAPQSALVRAATDLGTGYWAMTPMRLADGRTVWVNRGFVTEGTPLPAVIAGVPSGEARVVGLLRSTEPGGSLLQSNQPGADRWYSRDVAALSRARRTGAVLPAFVDTQSEQAAAAVGGVKPVPGLTVVTFPDNHLSYALTWFAMAALSGIGITLAWRRRGAT